MKQNPQKHLMIAVLFIATLTFANKSYSQSVDAGWILVKESVNVKFYYKTEICNNTETILYKISSSNDKTVNINWTVWRIETGENISINPSEEIIGSCEIENKLHFRIPPGTAIINNELPIVFTTFN